MKNHHRPRPQQDVSSIQPYQQGKSVLEDGARPIKLSSNESAYGPSPKAIEAYHASESTLHRYPDGSQQALREAIAEVYGLDMNNIICGNGSEELLGLLIRTYVGPSDELLITENHFVMCPIYGKLQGAKVVFAPEENHTVHVDHVLNAISSKTRMVIIANPNNPTGTYISADEMRRLHHALPPDVLLIIDAAYAEYVTKEDYETGLDMVGEYENVVITRTFSKIHGLAALRIGWAYCPDHIIEALQRARTPFNANAAAMAAATAAVRDTDYVSRVKERNAHSLKHMSEALDELGLRVIPSVANFYLLIFDGIPSKDAAGAARFLEANNIIPRPVSTGEAEDVLRITVGTDDENRAVISALRQYLLSN